MIRGHGMPCPYETPSASGGRGFFMPSFITFEGVEGCGKTTQIQLLSDHLAAKGLDVVVTREPGGTAISDQIRKILLDSQNRKMVPECELLLYYASRAQHVQEKILPALQAGSVVLCDRFVDATVAYQSYGRGIDISVLEALNSFVLKKFSPTLTLIFDLPVEIGLDRARKRAQALTQNEREDRLENEVIEFHQKVRAGYLQIAKTEPERVRVIDASGDVVSIHEQVIKLIEEIV